MPNPKPQEGHRNLMLEQFEEALLWQIDQLKMEAGMNRTSTLQEVLWRGLQAKGYTRAAVREAYDEHLRRNRHGSR